MSTYGVRISDDEGYSKLGLLYDYNNNIKNSNN